MKVLLKQLQAANKKIHSSKSFAEEFEAWKERVLLFDKKEPLEVVGRDAAKECEL